MKQLSTAIYHRNSLCHCRVLSDQEQVPSSFAGTTYGVNDHGIQPVTLSPGFVERQNSQQVLQDDVAATKATFCTNLLGCRQLTYMAAVYTRRCVSRSLCIAPPEQASMMVQWVLLRHAVLPGAERSGGQQACEKLALR